MAFTPVYLDNNPGTADTPKAAVDKLNENLLRLHDAVDALDTSLETLAGLNVLSADQKAAMVGTSGTLPSADNPFVDDADSRLVHPDADAEDKGSIRLAHHLGGSALYPEVVGVQAGTDSLLMGDVAEGQMVVRGANSILLGATVPSGSIVPTGTGFRHITVGDEDSLSKLVENADVHASAAIVESKLALSFPTHATTNDPVTGEKAALVGSMGTPGAGNKYVTEAHITGTPTASRVPIADLGGTLDAWITPDLGTIKALRYTLDNANSVLVATNYPLTIWPLYNGTIVSWSLAADAVGSVSIEIWKAAFGSVPVVGNKITASAPMVLSTEQFLTSTTMTGWTTTVADWDAFVFNVVSCSTIKRLEIILAIQVTGYA
jgi:hypothetical protein